MIKIFIYYRLNQGDWRKYLNLIYQLANRNEQSIFRLFNQQSVLNLKQT